MEQRARSISSNDRYFLDIIITDKSAPFILNKEFKAYFFMIFSIILILLVLLSVQTESSLRSSILQRPTLCFQLMVSSPVDNYCSHFGQWKCFYTPNMYLKHFMQKNTENFFSYFKNIYYSLTTRASIQIKRWNAVIGGFFD